jgi:DNA-binding beta-propeller fold protein YncE
LAADGSLYVADTLENRIIAIPNAVNRSSSDGNGTNLSNVSVLNDPLGLAIRPDNGDILVTNCNNGMLVVLSSTGNMKSTGFAPEPARYSDWLPAQMACTLSTMDRILSNY